MPGLRAVSACRFESAATLAGYVLVAFAFLGLRPLLAGGHRYVGYTYDPQIFIWALAWWPHAILHGQNPFVTHAIWAPDGVNLMWSTTVPGLALLLAPLTLLAGPFVAYDVAAVLMPALAAWTAYLLCGYLTRSLWPSIVGGYLFGFSSYLIAQDAYGGHLNLGSVFLLPLIALVILRFLDGELDGRGLVVRLVPLFALQILFSTEVAFGVGLAAVTAFLLCYALVAARRARLVALVAPAAASCVAAALVTAPFLYYLLSSGVRAPFYSSTTVFDTDLANLVVPTRLTAAGGSLLTGVSGRFLGNIPEQGAYLGLPILAILALYARARWRTPAGRFVFASLAVTLVVALGSRATIAGHQLFSLPWRLVSGLPVFDNVLTNRFFVYAALLSSVVVAAWTASERPGLLRWLLPGLAIVAIAPNPAASGFSTRYHVPAFFTQRAYRFCLDPGEIVLPFPTRGGGALLWQVESGFRFNMAAGDIGPDIPTSFFTPPEIAPIAGGSRLGTDQAGILRKFIALKDVTSIVADGSQANLWAGAIDQIAAPRVVGGVYLYHLSAFPPSCLAR